ncbi:pyridoxal phosphate-dependent aminotransferase [Bradymonas sediminis]|uniref:pyridoxal phosphate-dependent aminotransferase n=1 Tax=Bradymonas sediminis TaxID=1548548 RepID=UPI0010E51609|nr:pyridoxal phosphate-dependent aminotransferase [Bradymonas sediminis]TDP73952.1 aspartate aminotransferase [Bradymonas sediminis]
MIKLSARINRVEPSPTLAISARAKKMVANGIDVISFSAGEPDFNTPGPILEAAKQALDEGKTKYVPTPGVPALRAAIAQDYKKRGRTVDASQVVVTVGGKQALYNATQALFEEGDKVVIPAPYWVSYPAQVKLAGAEPVTVETDASADFKVTPDQLAEQLKDPAVRGVVLCSPSNPTGACYSAEELRALGEVLKTRDDVVIFFDAIYDRLYYSGDIAPDLVNEVPELAEQTVTFNGFSKTYAMTGWRLGYAIGPVEIISAMAKLQSQSTSNATTFAQYGAIEALKLSDGVLEEMRDIFKTRRDLIVDGLNAIDGVECATPAGAFYVFPDFSAHIGERFADDMALAEYLLETAKVALVPGSAFGAPGFLRMSYATGDALIEEGLKRIRAALASA